MQKKSKVIITSVSLLSLALILTFLFVPACREVFAQADFGPGEITASLISLSDIPEYSGELYSEINGNQPYFDSNNLTAKNYVFNSPMDTLGRVGWAMACLHKDMMPTEARGEIGNVRPTGWHTAHYDCVSGLYLYNRCHIIGFQLGGANRDEINLFTGTSDLNKIGMLLFENRVADYLRDSGNHVMYRATPVFVNNDLIATGIELEAYSVEDSGEGLSFNVFIYNVQPGIVIDYSTGDSREAKDDSEKLMSFDREGVISTAPAAPADDAADTTYILNTGTHKFHVPGCSSVEKISEAKRQDYTGSRDELIARGYEPCKRCAAG